MRENGFESVELNWFAAALTQTPEAPIIYPIIPRAHGKQTFPLRFVDGFHSQVLWLTQSSSFKRDGGTPQFSHRLCRLRETDSIRNVIQQPMIARESGTLEKSNELIKCFVCLVYFCHFANEAKDGRWHFLFYRQRVNSSQIDQALIPGCVCIFRSLESFKHFQVLSSIIVLLHTKHNKPGWWQRNNNVVHLSSLEVNHPLQQTQIDFMPFGQPDSVLSRRANGQSLSHLGPIHNPLCLFMDKQANGLLWSSLKCWP